MAEGAGTAAGRFADAVVVAAGSSSRMGGIDKLMEPIGGRTVLERSVAAMRAATSVDRIVVVAREDRIDDLARLANLGAVEIVAGGAERSGSVRVGVMATSAEVVLVHDAARPLVTPRLADAVAAAALEHGAAVPALPVADSLKRASGPWLEASVERAGLVRTQTPQGARRDVLRGALEAAHGRAFTDEAALLESHGVRVATVPGEATNLKLTEPADLDLARAIARSDAEERLGFGQDTHGFGPDTGLWLGGVLLDAAPRLYGHSDGDVVLHAIATAVLSAAGLGDLGRLFPATDSRTAGIASSTLLAEAVRQAFDAGWSVASAHVSLVGARPRLGPQAIDEMRDRLAALLDVLPERVAIVASTGNLAGPEGAGRVISATGLVRLHQR